MTNEPNSYWLTSKIETNVKWINQLTLMYCNSVIFGDLGNGDPTRKTLTCCCPFYMTSMERLCFKIYHLTNPYYPAFMLHLIIPTY